LKNWEFLKNFIWYIIGSILYAVAVAVFIAPNEISPGGLTGVSTIVNYLFSLPTGAILLILNIPILILGFLKFGGKFIINTSVVTVLSSVALTYAETFLPIFKGEKILASIFGGILLGMGISTIMLHGATTGGVDIVAKIINRKWRHFTVGKIILVLDGAVVLMAVIAYKNFESALYSMVSMFASSRIMDSLLYGGDRGKMVYTITDAHKEICEGINSELLRGVTVIEATGGYTGANHKMLICCVRAYEVATLYSIIEKYDPNAFITVIEAGEIIGEGFKKIN